jgi:hypothetical protein
VIYRTQNGTKSAAGFTANVVSLLWHSNNMYHANNGGEWYAWQGNNAWAKSTDPKAPPAPAPAPVAYPIGKIMLQALGMNFRSDLRPNGNGEFQTQMAQSGYSSGQNSSASFSGRDLAVRPKALTNQYLSVGVSIVNGSLAINNMYANWTNSASTIATQSNRNNPTETENISCTLNGANPPIYLPATATVGYSSPAFIPQSCQENIQTYGYSVTGSFESYGNVSRSIQHGFWLAVLPSVRAGYALVCLDTFIDLRDTAPWLRYCVRADQSGNVDGTKVPWLAE